MARATPWGTAQQTRNHARGISTVSTSSHGGLLIGVATAKRYLSEAALKHGHRYGGYLCYEEDCAYEIPLYDSAYIRDVVAKDVLAKGITLDHLKHELWKSLSRWYPDYLLELNVVPDEKPHREWTHEQKASEMRAERHPLLVICCWDSDATMLAGVNLVETADGTRHYVCSKSYRRARENNSILLTIEDMEIVDQSNLDPISARFLDYLVGYSNELLRGDADQSACGQEKLGRRFCNKLSYSRDGLRRHFLEDDALSLEEANRQVERLTIELYPLIDDKFKNSEAFMSIDSLNRQ